MCSQIQASQFAREREDHQRFHILHYLINWIRKYGMANRNHLTSIRSDLGKDYGKLRNIEKEREREKLRSEIMRQINNRKQNIEQTKYGSFGK